METARPDLTISAPHCLESLGCRHDPDRDNHRPTPTRSHLSLAMSNAPAACPSQRPLARSSHSLRSPTHRPFATTQMSVLSPADGPSTNITARTAGCLPPHYSFSARLEARQIELRLQRARNRAFCSPKTPYLCQPFRNSAPCASSERWLA
ncbi:hypothetical protein LIA77_09595 [Sarocladium implicatum]|nr:hypothetical protein LIA77_09595 [Sarocladium implicatum]